MGFLNLFSKSTPGAAVEGPLTGSLAVDRAGKIVATTLSSQLAPALLTQIGRTALHAFAAARRIQTPLTELVTSYGENRVTAIELRGGALIFINPGRQLPTPTSLPAMGTPDLDDFILYLETYIECWKQFNHYINLAHERADHYGEEDEARFLEVKSLITQGLEVILATVESGAPRKEEVLNVINNVPSIRSLAARSNQITAVESQWHKIYLSLQSLLGRLKVQQQKAQEGGWNLGTLFNR